MFEIHVLQKQCPTDLTALGAQYPQNVDSRECHAPLSDAGENHPVPAKMRVSRVHLEELVSS